MSICDNYFEPNEKSQDADAYVHLFSSFFNLFELSFQPCGSFWKKILFYSFNLRFKERSISDKHQSAYTRFHFNETALFDVFSKMLWSLNNKQTFLLILLDLTAALDAVDQQIEHFFQNWNKRRKFNFIAFFLQRPDTMCVD